MGQLPQPTERQRIHVIGTGGTIASRSVDGGGAVSADTVPDLLAAAGVTVPISHKDVVNLNSFRLTFTDLAHISAEVERACQDPDVAGVVITHGTDTIEETAFLLDLVHGYRQPVVITGAQKAADLNDTDGPRNLYEAVLVAADPAMAGSGVSVSFAGQVQSARGVRKAHTLAPSPFTGGIHFASVVGQRVIRHATVMRRESLPRPNRAFGQIRVDVIDAGLGASPNLIHASLRSGAHGVVLAGTGVGNAPDGFVDAVAQATKQGNPVVLATRVAHGPVTAMYADGGGVDLVKAGARLAGMLTVAQARMLLALLISHGFTDSELHAAFTTYAYGN